MLIFSVVLYLKIIIIIIIIIMITYSFFKNIIIIIIIIIIIVIIIIIDSMNATGTWLHYGKSVIVVITVFVPWGLVSGGRGFQPDYAIFWVAVYR